jgi:hypothetical protein
MIDQSQTKCPYGIKLTMEIRQYFGYRDPSSVEAEMRNLHGSQRRRDFTNYRSRRDRLDDESEALEYTNLLPGETWMISGATALNQNRQPACAHLSSGVENMAHYEAIRMAATSSP